MLLPVMPFSGNLPPWLIVVWCVMRMLPPSCRIHPRFTVDQMKKKPGMPCRSCHPDHQGPNAPLTDMSKADIQHDAFGYSLNAHQRQTDGSPFECKTCHVNGYTQFDQTVCTTCHQQINLQFMQSHLQALW